MANNVTGIQNIEPWIYQSGLDINDTDYGLMDVLMQNTGDNLNFNTTDIDNTATQLEAVYENPEVANINADSYDNALMSLQDTSTSQKTDRYGNTTYSGGDLGLMGAFDYADDLEPMVPDYEQSAIDRTIDSNIPKESGFNWGGIGEGLAKGLMGYADALSNEYMYGGFGSREGNTRERLMRGRPSQAYRTGSSY